MKKGWMAFAAGVALLLTLGAVAAEQGDRSGRNPQQPAATDPSPHPMDPGVGPVKSVELGPIDPQLVKTGKGLFQRKCAVCHALDARRVGPALGDVTKTRAPEFIMNMMLNSANMEREDPAVRKLRDEYHVPMPDQQLDRAQSRAILEYLRSAASSAR